MTAQPTRAEQARAFLATAHQVPLRAALRGCNWYLDQLRRGSRRRRYHGLRVEIRALRDRLARVIRSCMVAP